MIAGLDLRQFLPLPLIIFQQDALPQVCGLIIEIPYTAIEGMSIRKHMIWYGYKFLHLYMVGSMVLFLSGSALKHDLLTSLTFRIVLFKL
jgi:hypothetical protein